MIEWITAFLIMQCRKQCWSQIILGFFLILSVCNSSPCSHQSLPRQALPQEEPSPTCTEFVQRVISILPQFSQHACMLEKFLCKLVFRSFGFYLLVCVGPCTLFSQHKFYEHAMCIGCAVNGRLAGSNSNSNSSPGHISSLFAKPWQFPNHIMLDWKASSMQCNLIKHKVVAGFFSHFLWKSVQTCKHM